jgi:dTDP-4-dehydrorhamnose 3,5-epimerase
MLLTECAIEGAFLVEMEPRRDERGFLARTFSAEEFAARGLETVFVQSYASFTRHRGTIRGMHYQVDPAAEAKLVRCLRGAVLDVTVDLRPQSPTFMKHIAVELSASNRRSLYLPPLCAHGIQALSDNVEYLNSSTAFYAPEHERGLRFDDPALAIEWPLPVMGLSPKDASWEPYGPPVLSPGR